VDDLYKAGARASKNVGAKDVKPIYEVKRYSEARGLRLSTPFHKYADVFSPPPQRVHTSVDAADTSVRATSRYEAVFAKWSAKVAIEHAMHMAPAYVARGNFK